MSVFASQSLIQSGWMIWNQPNSTTRKRLKSVQHMWSGKSRLNNLPKAKERAKKPMNRINMDLVSSSVFSLEGHDYALVITDCCTGYQGLSRPKTRCWKWFRNDIVTLLNYERSTKWSITIEWVTLWYCAWQMSRKRMQRPLNCNSKDILRVQLAFVAS